MEKKILVVDDSELIHQIYRLCLTRHNFEIVDAMNGKEALDILGKQRDFQFILLDINMPVMNGLQFMEKASEQGLVKNIPVIIISTEGKEQDTIRGMQLGARGYLKKPFNPSDLYALIEKIQSAGSSIVPTGNPFAVSGC